MRVSQLFSRAQGCRRPLEVSHQATQQFHLKGVQRPAAFAIVCFCFWEFRFSGSYGAQVADLVQGMLVFAPPLNCKLAVSEFGSYSNTNSKSTKSTVFIIDSYAKDGSKKLFTKMHCVQITILLPLSFSQSSTGNNQTTPETEKFKQCSNFIFFVCR